MTNHNNTFIFYFLGINFFKFLKSYLSIKGKIYYYYGEKLKIVKSFSKDLSMALGSTNYALVKELEFKLNFFVIGENGHSSNSNINFKVEFFCGEKKCAPEIISGTTALDTFNKFKKSITMSKKFKNVEILWASVREPYNYLQAKQLGCHIITVPPNIIEKIENFGKTYQQLTKETVKTFLLDSKKSKFRI